MAVRQNDPALTNNKPTRPTPLSCRPNLPGENVIKPVGANTTGIILFVCILRVRSAIPTCPADNYFQLLQIAAASTMNMLKLIFLIGALATLAQSQIAVEWICSDTKAMGNCTRVPKITDMLQNIAQNNDDDVFTDFHYCPYYIVERHVHCLRTYYNSCYRSMSETVRNTFMASVPIVKTSAKDLCDENRPYKKEFRDHAKCGEPLLNADDDWDDFMEDTEMQYGKQLDGMSARDRCKLVGCYWRDMNTDIRQRCGAKTEKFSRIVLSYIWPLSIMSVDRECKKFENRCTT